MSIIYLSIRNSCYESNFAHDFKIFLDVLHWNNILCVCVPDLQVRIVVTPSHDQRLYHCYVCLLILHSFLLTGDSYSKFTRSFLYSFCSSEINT